MFTSMLRAIMNLCFKGSKNRTIQMDDSDYKRLKSEMIESNNLEIW